MLNSALQRHALFVTARHIICCKKKLSLFLVVFTTRSKLQIVTSRNQRDHTNPKNHDLKMCKRFNWSRLPLLLETGFTSLRRKCVPGFIQKTDSVRMLNESVTLSKSLSLSYPQVEDIAPQNQVWSMLQCA
jgi:hypothetical protein